MFTANTASPAAASPANTAIGAESPVFGLLPVSVTVFPVVVDCAVVVGVGSSFGASAEANKYGVKWSVSNVNLPSFTSTALSTSTNFFAVLSYLYA